MQEYIYKARDKNGKLIISSIPAESMEDARNKITKTTDLFVIDVNKKNRLANIFNFSIFGNQVSQKDLIFFTRQLKTLVESGLPLVESLAFLMNNLTNKTFKRIISEVYDDVSSGNKLSDSLAKFPTVFNKEYIQLIRVSEASGNLDKILETISENLEERFFLKKKINSALAYPKFATVVVIAVTIFMLTVILPKMISMYNSSGTALPAPTAILLKISGFLTHNFVLLLAIVGVIFVSFRLLYSKNHNFAIFIDKIKTKIPLIGKITYMSSIIKFLETFSLLQKSGLSIVLSLDLSKESMQNNWMESKMEKAIDLVIEGKSVSYAIESQGIFPDLLYKIIAIGENSGRLTEVMDKTSEFWKNELDDSIKTMSSQIEPVMTVVLGIIVGFIAVAMYMPIFNMVKVLKKQ